MMVPMYQDLEKIASRFRIDGNIQSIDELGEGFINDTFIVKTSQGDCPHYLLQKKNRTVFADIPSMMDNILKVTGHLKRKITERGGDPMVESMTVIPANDGKNYLTDEHGEFWTLAVYIADGFSHEKVLSEEMACEGGRGIGLFHAMLADLEEPLTNILPGFHDIIYRFRQWDEILRTDRAGRRNLVKEEIRWINDRRTDMLEFGRFLGKKILPKRVVHNDTKINNILFNNRGKAICMIDLDTVMNGTILNDFGDAIRTFANQGKEDDPDLRNVSLDMKIFKSFSLGYIQEARSFLTGQELENLAFSARFITFEQVIRFLMDYIDGDRYYRIKGPDHNLIRSRAQFQLLSSMEDRFAEMQGIIKDISSGRGR